MNVFISLERVSWESFNNITKHKKSSFIWVLVVYSHTLLNAIKVEDVSKLLLLKFQFCLL